MTTKAQLRKTALSLPAAVEDQRDGLLTYTVHGKVFAALTADKQVALALDEATVRNSLRHCSITRTPGPNGDQLSVSVPLADVNGMELNNLVFKSWLNQAPNDLASAARAAMKSEAPSGPDALPETIGMPATRALLLAGITTLEQVATHTEAQLLELHGVGPRAVKILREALSATGREMAG
ncbi:MAG: hypothetical protein WDA03_05160 [Trueperaceae bacterium]